MSAEHLTLAAIFAVLFVIPLAWLFLVDSARQVTGSRVDDASSEPPTGTAAHASLD